MGDIAKRKSGRGGRRPGAGRPAGRKSIRAINDEFRELLEPLDKIGMAKLAKIITEEEDPEIVMRAIEIAWSYRHGKPVPVKPDTENKQVFNLPQATGVMVVEVDGDEKDYISSLRRIRGEVVDEDDDIALLN